jgi:hypothetical protein
MGDSIYLTKAQLLNGAAYFEVLDLKSVKGKVRVRGLTEAEKSLIDADFFKSGMDSSLAGLNADDQKAAQMKAGFDIMSKEADAKCQAVAFGLSCDGELYTIDEIRGMPALAIQEIYEHVLRLTGVENINPFFRIPGRARPFDSGNDGQAHLAAAVDAVANSILDGSGGMQSGPESV